MPYFTMFLILPFSLLKTIGKFDIEEPAVLTLDEICNIKLGSYLQELPTAVEAAKLHILQCKVRVSLSEFTLHTFPGTYHDAQSTFRF